MNEILPDRRNFVNDDGDVLSVDDLSQDEQLELNMQYDMQQTALNEKKQWGVFVSLTDRAIAIKALAGIYARQNRARGLSKAVNNPGLRRGIGRRYGNPNELADAAAKKSLQEYAGIALYMEVLTKETELKDAGFNWDDVEDAAAYTAINVRHAIGTNRLHGERQKIVHRVEATAKRIK